MKNIPQALTVHKKAVVIFFVVSAIICGILAMQLKVNYNLTDYLPNDAKSTIAIRIMEKEFTQTVPNARVMVSNVSIAQAQEYKEKLAAVKGVTEVLWLDDIVDVKQPLAMADQKTVQDYYRDDTALFSINIAKGAELSAMNSIYELIGDDNAMIGEAVNIGFAQKYSASETTKAFIILIPLIIIVLVLATSSWLEPILFLVTIGIAILLNMGTSVFAGEMSFMTQAISPILQMAVSLDYAIFLLHSFGRFRLQTKDVNMAMQLAMKESFSSILASAATTFFGFIALAFMKFGIGADLGLNLVKGIVFSFVSVMVFLPALTLFLYKYIDKTRHRNFIPDFKNIGKRILKLKIPALIVLVLVVVPVFLAQGQNTFIYGMGDSDAQTRSGVDANKINSKFGQSTPIVLLLPKGDPAKEFLLAQELKQQEHVTSVMSYATTVDAKIPSSFLDENITSQFYSENYARMIVNTDTVSEGDVAFDTVERVHETASIYYGDQYYSAGQSVSLYDMKEVVEVDTSTVNMIAVISIALVLLVTFRSLTFPILLVLTIETAIWINLSVSYFSNTAICYIGYLVISTVQLGATVDYAILLSNGYRQNRMSMPKKEAMMKTLSNHVISILTSGIILATAGFCLFLTSSLAMVADLGVLLCRGTILSMIMVIIFLPALLTVFDGIIGKTTWKAKFYKE